MGGHAGPREMAGEASPRSAGGCGMRNAPELVDVESDRLEEVLRRAERALDEEDAELIRAVFESYAYVADLVEDKDTSIRRLRQLFFGASTEKTEAVVGRKPRKPDAAPPSDVGAETDLAEGEGSLWRVCALGAARATDESSDEEDGRHGQTLWHGVDSGGVHPRTGSRRVGNGRAGEVPTWQRKVLRAKRRFRSRRCPRRCTRCSAT